MMSTTQLDLSGRVGTLGHEVGRQGVPATEVKMENQGKRGLLPGARS